METGNSRIGPGTLYVVGIGPGYQNARTYAAQNILKQADVIVGYQTYINLIADLTEGKRVDCSGMHNEQNRVMRAIEYAEHGECVALISSGDPGVYGMAGLALEICKAKNCTVAIQILPGVTAAHAAAALLGAPLSCDYCVVSLSDLLVAPEQILMRVRCAASADFVTVLYNPVSTKRNVLIRKVQDIFLEYQNAKTPVGIVINGYRKGQSVTITSLDIFTDTVSDMVTTIIIGNSQTVQWNNSMITPRGYAL